MVHAARRELTPDDHERLNRRTLAAFFAVLDILVRAEVSVVAEAAYQDRLWRRGLSALLPLAHVLLVRCRVDAELARARQEDRLRTDPRRLAHEDLAQLTAAPVHFDWPRLDVPTLDLDTEADPATAAGSAAEFVLSAGAADD